MTKPSKDKPVNMRQGDLPIFGDILGNGVGLGWDLLEGLRKKPKTLDKIAKRLNLGFGQKLNSLSFEAIGGNGSVITFGDPSKLLKVTKDEVEADSAFQLKKTPIDGAYRIYDVFKVSYFESFYHTAYFIVMERLEPPSARLEDYIGTVAALTDRRGDTLNVADAVRTVEEIYPGEFDDYNQWLTKVSADLAKIGIVHKDFHEGNVMQRADGSPVIIDIGGYSIAPEQKLPAVSSLLKALAGGIENVAVAGAGTLKDLKKQFSDKQSVMWLDELATHDPSGNKYIYLPWMWRQFREGADLNDVVMKLGPFHRLATQDKTLKLPRTLKELDRLLEENEEELALLYDKEDHKERKSNPPKVLFDEDGFKAVELFNKQQMQECGKGTTWCVSGEGTNYYEEYDVPGTRFILITLPDGKRRMAMLSGGALEQLRDEQQTGGGDVPQTDMSRWVLDELELDGNWDEEEYHFQKKLETLQNDAILRQIDDDMLSRMERGNYPAYKQWSSLVTNDILNSKDRFDQDAAWDDLKPEALRLMNVELEKIKENWDKPGKAAHDAYDDLMRFTRSQNIMDIVDTLGRETRHGYRLSREFMQNMLEAILSVASKHLKNAENTATSNLVTARTLYHGTTKDAADSIMKMGLILPDTGDFINDMYGISEDDESSEDDGWSYKNGSYQYTGKSEDDGNVDLVFMADKHDLKKSRNAIVHHVAKKLNKDPHKLSENDIRNHGALIIVKEAEYTKHGGENERDNHPSYVEPGDYYSSEPVGADSVLTGQKLLSFFKKHGLEVVYSPTFKSKKALLLRMAVKLLKLGVDIGAPKSKQEAKQTIEAIDDEQKLDNYLRSARKLLADKGIKGFGE